MRSLICPVSNEKIPEAQLRINAFFVILLLLAFLITEFLPLIIFLATDFAIRGFSFIKSSPVSLVSAVIIRKLRVKSRQIERAPKLFAARLGTVMILLAIVLSVLDFSIAAKIVSLMVVSLSALECIKGICVGCYLYSWLVLPVSNRK